MFICLAISSATANHLLSPLVDIELIDNWLGDAYSVNLASSGNTPSTHIVKSLIIITELDATVINRPLSGVNNTLCAPVELLPSTITSCINDFIFFGLFKCPGRCISSPILYNPTLSIDATAIQFASSDMAQETTFCLLLV